MMMKIFQKTKAVWAVFRRNESLEKEKTMNKTFIILVLALASAFFGCTANQRAKSWGGKATILLPKNQKLINATWKDSQIWYLTRPMQADDKEEVYTFQEQSSFGILEGTVFIEENKE